MYRCPWRLKKNLVGFNFYFNRMRQWCSFSTDTVVMSFGDGSHGALGLPIGDAFEPTPVPNLPSDVSAVSTGHYHSLAVTSGGDLWSWGRNNESQLGRPASGDSEWNIPKRVEGLDNVKVCASFASGVVSAVIDEDGSLWVWGKSKRGQLGLGKDVIEALLPSKVDALAEEKVSKVSFGWGHALVKTEDGKLFGWGYSADGRIGKTNDAVEPYHPDVAIHNREPSTLKMEVAEKLVLQGMEKEKDMPIVWEPRLVEELRNVEVIDVACGLDHSLILCRDGTLLSCGDNSYGQLGRANAEIGIFPVDLNSHAISIASGLGHCLSICGRNIVSWGWNRSGQLGRTGQENLPSIIKGMETEIPVSGSCGRVHSLALTSKRELWVWGCGKNGRLGLGSSSDEVEPVLVELDDGLPVLQAVAGFDHTLILVPA